MKKLMPCKNALFAFQYLSVLFFLNLICSGVIAQRPTDTGSALVPADSTIVVEKINTYSFEIRDVRTGVVHKSMSYPDILRANPFVQFFNSRLEEKIQPEVSFPDISTIQRKELEGFLKNTPAPFYEENVLDRLNYVFIPEGKILPYSTGVIIEYVARFYENQSDYDDPVLVSTMFLRVDTNENERLVWSDNYLYQTYDNLLSRDGRFILSQLNLGAGEGGVPEQVGLFLVDLVDGTKNEILAFPNSKTPYEQARASSINGRYFLEIYENYEGSIIRLIVDPYTRTYYTGSFECPNVEEYRQWEDNLYKSVFEKEQSQIDF
ncbi:MAG: hypothetical protein R2792_09630 [Saprospiraceae bacterium]